MRLRRYERVVGNDLLLAGLFVQTMDCTRNYAIPPLLHRTREPDPECS